MSEGNEEKKAEPRVYRPQHLMTVPPAPSKVTVLGGNEADVGYQSKQKEWPPEWKDNPNAIKLASQHQEWKGHVVTLQLQKLLLQRELELSNFAADMAVDGTKSDSNVRIVAARLNELKHLKKVINETEQFVKSIIGS